MANGVKNKILDTLSRISDIVMELSSITRSSEVTKAISRLINKWITADEEFFFKPIYEKDKIVDLKELEGKNFSEEIEEMVFWALKKLNPTIFPLDEDEKNRNLFLLPITRSTKVLMIYAALTYADDISFEMMTFTKLLGFLAGSLLESLELSDAIEENRKFLNHILNAILDGIIVYDENMNELFKNSKFDRILENVGDELLEEIKNVFNILKSGVQTNSKEIDIKERTIAIDAIRIEGEKVSFLFVVSDITGTKELERLKKLDKMKMEFLSMISHELRTPLAAIRSYAETLYYMSEEMDPDTLKDFMQTILKESEHLQFLLDDLLDFSRLELKTLKLEKKEFDIVELAEEVIEGLKDLANNMNVKLIKDLPNHSITINADRTRIRQVLINLLQNSIKYRDKRKEEKYAKLVVEDKNDKILIIVEDNGIGIPKEVGNKIFDKFYRVDSSLTYEISGTGMGLSISKELVEMHGGRIWFESEEGVGTKFYVELPKK